MTFPSADRLLLICFASSSRWSVAPVLETISDPARSTRNSLPVLTVRSIRSFWATEIMQMAWLRLLSSFIPVAETCRLCDPRLSTFFSSPSRFTTTSVAPSM